VSRPLPPAAASTPPSSSWFSPCPSARQNRPRRADFRGPLAHPLVSLKSDKLPAPSRRQTPTVLALDLVAFFPDLQRSFNLVHLSLVLEEALTLFAAQLPVVRSSCMSWIPPSPLLATTIAAIADVLSSTTD